MKQPSHMIISACSLALLFCLEIGAQQEVLDSALAPIRRIQRLRCSIKRHQKVAEITRVAEGEFLFDRIRGFLYLYTTPGSYLFVGMGDTLSTVDLAKRTGFRVLRSEGEAFWDLYRSIHRIGVYLDLGGEPSAPFTFRGSIDDSLYFFRVDKESGGELHLRICRQSGRIDCIERIDAGGVVVEKVHCGLKNTHEESPPPFPSSLVFRRAVGDKTVVDSLRVTQIKINEVIPDSAFVLPGDVRWQSLPALPPEFREPQ